MHTCTFFILALELKSKLLIVSFFVSRVVISARFIDDNLHYTQRLLKEIVNVLS